MIFCILIYIRVLILPGMGLGSQGLAWVYPKQLIQPSISLYVSCSYVHRLKKEGIVMKAPYPPWFLVDTKS
jgi:hypothetical protein